MKRKKSKKNEPEFNLPPCYGLDSLVEDDEDEQEREKDKDDNRSLKKKIFDVIGITTGDEEDGEYKVDPIIRSEKKRKRKGHM